MPTHGPPSLTASCENALCGNSTTMNTGGLIGGGTESIGGTLVIDIGTYRLAA